MKKLVNKVNDKITEKAVMAQSLLRSQHGEGFVDTAIKILMAVVIGALVLGGLYALFGETVLFSSRYKHDRKCYA